MPTTPKPEEPKLLPLVSTDISHEQRAAALARLREPFSENQISLLPKQVRRDDKDKGNCTAPRSQFSADGKFCGGYHARSVHLDYVGHAALTDRLLEVDLLWDWEPLALTDAGLPQLDRDGGMWIKLTVAGVTRLGFGDAQGKTGPNATKEVIGDALRNAGMRFGMALDLWHKGDLHDAATEQGQVVTSEGERVDPEANVTPGRDWVKDAAAAKTSADYLELWTEAKKLRVPAETIALMKVHGTALKEAEDKAAAEKKLAEEAAAEEARLAQDAAVEAEATAQQTLAGGFGNQPTEEPPQ